MDDKYFDSQAKTKEQMSRELRVRENINHLNSLVATLFLLGNIIEKSV